MWILTPPGSFWPCSLLAHLPPTVGTLALTRHYSGTWPFSSSRHIGSVRIVGECSQTTLSTRVRTCAQPRRPLVQQSTLISRYLGEHLFATPYLTRRFPTCVMQLDSFITFCISFRDSQPHTLFLKFAYIKVHSRCCRILWVLTNA